MPTQFYVAPPPRIVPPDVRPRPPSPRSPSPPSPPPRSPSPLPPPPSPPPAPPPSPAPSTAPPRPAHSIASLKQAIDNLIRALPETLDLPSCDGGPPVTLRFDAQRHIDKLEHATRKLYGRTRTSRFWRQRRDTTALHGNCRRLHTLLRNYRDATADLCTQLALAKQAMETDDPKRLLVHYHAIISHCITCTERLNACRGEIPKKQRRSCMRLILRVSLFVAGTALAGVLAPFTALVPLLGLLLSFWEYWRERNSSAWNSLDAAVRAFADEVVTMERIVQARSAEIAETHRYELSRRFQALERRESRHELRIGEIAIAELQNMALIDSLEQSVRQIRDVIVDWQNDADGPAKCHALNGVHAALLPLRRLRGAPLARPDGPRPISEHGMAPENER